MKKLVIIFCLISLSIRATSDTLPSYHEDTILNVYASSGMKLRAFPNKNAEVLDIVRYGDEVVVINTFAFSDDKADRIDWLDGHWILVEYDGIAGYLFDAYLSALPFPGSLEEICQDGYSYDYTLGAYFDRNFAQHQILDSSANKKVYLLDKGIKVKRIFEEHVWTIEIEIPQMGINEILNLMRSMLPDKSSQVQFENALIFIEGPDSKINEIKVNMGDSVTLKRKANGHLLVKASGVIGC
jgi:hypothetical protein